MKVVVFGANGPTGRILTKQALIQGHTVTAVTRHRELFPLKHTRLQVLHGNVFDYASVEQAIAGQDAVLSSLGVSYSREPITVYSQGVTHIMRAMSLHNIRRLICVSSSATDPQLRSHDTGGGFAFEKLLKPLLINSFGRTLYEDMWKMETLVMNSRLEWTIIRPSGLFDTPTPTAYRVAESFLRARFTSRADLADCMLRQLSNETYLQKTLAIATDAVQPNLFGLIVREALQKRAS